MAKTKTSLHVRLPPYRAPRLAWRRAVFEAVSAAAKELGVVYRPEDKIALQVTLYFPRAVTHWHDVDNRLKDVMDALQGRLGGPKRRRQQPAMLPNDSQVYRVTVEKLTAPPQSLSRGHLWISRA